MEKVVSCRRPVADPQTGDGRRERLRAGLCEWAMARGFTVPYRQLPDGIEPDVLRGSPDGRLLLIGAAMLSPDEGIDDAAACTRADVLRRAFAEQIGGAGCRGRVFAVATGDAHAAGEWAAALNFFARAAALVSLRDATARVYVAQRMLEVGPDRVSRPTSRGWPGSGRPAGRRPSC